MDDARIFRAADRPVLINVLAWLYRAILDDVTEVHRLIPRADVLRTEHPVYRPGEQHRRDPCPQKGPERAPPDDRALACRGTIVNVRRLGT